MNNIFQLSKLTEEEKKALTLARYYEEKLEKWWDDAKTTGIEIDTGSDDEYE